MGQLWWMHVASTDTLTLYEIAAKRGYEGIDVMGILPRFIGIAVHDHWKSYYRYTLCAHAECNAHILRNLIFLYEDCGFAWAGLMCGLLLKIKKHVDLTKTFDNNQAERDIRMPKAKQKISGGFRSETGSKAFAVARSFISTCIKRGLSVIDGFNSVLEGNALSFLGSDFQPQLL